MHMPNLGVIGELIVKIKAEDAKETAKEIRDVQKTTKEAGEESRRQIPVLERMGRRWEMVLGMVAATGAVLFGMIAKSSPSVMGALKGIQLAFESIWGLIGEELSPVFEWLEDLIWKLSEAFEALPPGVKTFIAGLAFAVIVAGFVAVAVVALVAVLPMITAAVAAVVAYLGVSLGWLIVIVGAVAVAVALLYTVWKHNWGGIRDITKSVIEYIQDLIGRGTAWIKGIWVEFLGIIGDENLNTYGKVKKIWALFKEKVLELSIAMANEAKKIWGKLKVKLIEIVEYIKLKIPIILEKLKVIMGVIWADIKSSAAELWDDIKKIIIDKITDAYDTVIGKFNAMRAALRKTIKYFADNPIVRIIKIIKKTVSKSSGDSSTSRQFGGPVSAGAAYTVGEVGPELFVPDVSGAIIPNNRMPDTKSTQVATSGRPIDIKLDLKLDGRTVWESVRRYSAAELIRLGG